MLSSRFYIRGLVSIFWHVFHDTEGGVEDTYFAAGFIDVDSEVFYAITQLKELSLSDVIFAIACTSNPFINSACLLDMVLEYFFGSYRWACIHTSLEK